jgi:ABC-type antimicrobial peptide transport system permease subunit
VVGVVGDIHSARLDSAFTRQVWMSASRGWPMPQRLIVRSRTPPEALAPAVRAVLADLAPSLALGNLRTMDEIVSDATASRRFIIVILAAFAVIALVLCGVGIYGLLAYQVGQRAREIGIRVALGARPEDVARAVLTQTATGVLAGIAAGVAWAWALSSVIATQLFEMSPTDLRVYGGVTSFVAVVTALSGWAPARRATRVNPVDVLRN